MHVHALLFLYCKICFLIMPVALSTIIMASHYTVGFYPEWEYFFKVIVIVIITFLK